MGRTLLRHDSVASLVTAAATRRPDALAVADVRGTHLSWAALEGLANQLARGLLTAGLVPGDRLMAILDERAEQLVLHAAAAKAGLVLVPANFRFTAAELAALAVDCGPQAMVCDAERGATVLEAVRRLDHPPALLVSVGEDRPDDPLRPWRALVTGQSAASLALAGGRDLLYLGYTSGTTGAPKGVMLDHRTVLLGASVAARAYGLPPYGVNVLGGSMSFVSVVVAHVWAHVALTSGIVLPGRFSVDRQLEMIERHDATFTYVPSPAIPEATRALAAHPEVVSRLRAINVGASPIPAAVLSAFADVVGERVVGVYGMTEGAGVPLVAARPSDWRRPEVGFERAGAVVSPAVMRIAGSDDEDQPRDGESVGEIVVASPVMMSGYWGNTEATSASLGQGWLRTGDLGSLTSDGFLRIHGRAKDMLVSGGINIYPAEIEAVVQAHPSVTECAVVGRPDARWGERPVAFVTIAAGASDSEVLEQVPSWCRERLANYKRPSTITILSAFPRNANGKILKTSLRDADPEPDRPAR